MLSEVISGAEKSNFILITDSADCLGWEMFFAFINECSVKYDHVHAFLFDKLPDEFLTSLLPDRRKNLIVHDFCTDPLGWIDPGNAEKLGKNFSLQAVLRQSGKLDGSCAVVIDSMSTWLRHCSIQNVCFNIQDLNQSFSKEQKSYSILSLFHADLLNERCMKSLEYVASTVLHLVWEKDALKEIAREKKTHKARRKLCKMIHRKQSGKGLEATYSFGVVKGLVIDIALWNPEFEYKDILNKPPSSANSEDPTANLTFNLSLSSSEKTARSKLVMPYTKTRHLEVKLEEDSPTTKGSGDEGLIYYEPDDADDFDEEDPDDDLDF